MNKFYMYILSIIFILISILIFFGVELPTKITGGHKQDITDSLFYLFVSLIFLYLAYKSKKQITHSICPKCEETFNHYELKDGMCPYCNVATKDLDGYYDNKDNEITKNKP